MLKRLTTTPFLLLLLALTLSGGRARALEGGLYGDVTVGAQSYRGESGAVLQEASSLYQQYTLTYSSQGLLRDRRLGSYRLLVGYEFNAVDPEFSLNGAPVAGFGSITTDKLYYDASMFLAPGGLPFRFSLFANDLHRTTFLSESLDGFAVGSQPAATFGTGHLIDPRVYGDLANGTHRAIGGTLLVGIRNGSYLGAYRDLLSQLPRLLIDYRQDDVRNLHSTSSKQHFRTRDLAFVSLNKKDNWVHFRTQDHADFLNPQNNASTTQVMIGTVDHRLTRQWINLTNWIRLSTDFSYTVDREARGRDEERLYALNLFATGRRQALATTLLSRFERRSDGRQVFYDADVPFYATYEPNRDTLLRSRLDVRTKKTALFAGIVLPADQAWLLENSDGQGFSDIYLANAAELRRTAAVVYKPQLEVETRSDAAGSGVALRLGGELASNHQRSRETLWTAGSSLTLLQAQSDADGSRNYQQLDLRGNVERQLERNWRLGARASLAYGTGSGRSSLAFRIPVLNGQLAANPVTDDEDGSIARGDVAFFADHQWQRLGNRLELRGATLATGSASEFQTSLTHTLRFDDYTNRLRWTTLAATGDGTQALSGTSINYLSPRTVSQDIALSWRSGGSYEYAPDRRLRALLRAEVNDFDGTDANTIFSLGQELGWRIFTTNGIIRRLAEFTEEIGYEASGKTIDGRDSALFGKFSASYYPTKFLYGTLTTALVHYGPGGARQTTLGAETGFNFEKLKIALSYANGYKAKEVNALAEVREQRWDVKVKKTF